jgi:hypothetical protein
LTLYTTFFSAMFVNHNQGTKTMPLLLSNLFYFPSFLLFFSFALISFPFPKCFVLVLIFSILSTPCCFLFLSVSSPSSDRNARPASGTFSERILSCHQKGIDPPFQERLFFARYRVQNEKPKNTSILSLFVCLALIWFSICEINHKRVIRFRLNYVNNNAKKLDNFDRSPRLFP